MFTCLVFPSDILTAVIHSIIFIECTAFNKPSLTLLTLREVHDWWSSSILISTLFITWKWRQQLSLKCRKAFKVSSISIRRVDPRNLSLKLSVCLSVWQYNPPANAHDPEPFPSKFHILRLKILENNLTYQTHINSMEQTHSWEPDSRLAGKELIRLAWNSKVQYRFPHLDQFNPVHIHKIIFRSILILFPI
jgi:hypothetical protein